MKIRLQDEKSLMYEQVEMYKDVVAHTFNRVGRCYFQENSFHEALKQHESALQLTIDMKEQETTNTNIATYLKNMGKCMFKIRRWNAANDHFSKAANIWKETEEQSFLLEIDECNVYMRQCKMFCGESQLYGERLVQLSHSQLENPEIGIDHCEEYEVLKNHGEDYDCRPRATARLGNSHLQCGVPGLPDRSGKNLREDRSPQSDLRYRNVATERLIKLRVPSHPVLHEANRPTPSSPARRALFQRNPFRVKKKPEADIASPHGLLTPRKLSTKET